jgi:hypothetical protein
VDTVSGMLVMPVRRLQQVLDVRVRLFVRYAWALRATSLAPCRDQNSKMI